jgi:hypothetical protein
MKLQQIAAAVTSGALHHFPVFYPDWELNSLKINESRGGQIRTDDFLLPKQALYQAELRPVWGANG